MDNVLDPVDQSMFDLGRAVGVTIVAQGVWVYNRAIDIEGLRQFHDHLQRGRLSRRIERSPLGFGRHRWISPNGSAAIEIVASARPREEFTPWLNEQANTPLDCEHGPVWRLAVLPFTDGGAGVSLAIPHCVTDGLGMLEALEDAAFGRDDPISWPAGASRRRWQAVREDARQTVRDIPSFGRAFVASVRLARNSRNGARRAAPPHTPPSTLPAGADDPIAVPVATIFVDAEEWDARAHAIGGTSNALLVGVAAHLAQRRGRLTADGLATIRIPVNERIAGDTRGNAVGNVDITVDPAPATTDLREIRAAIKQGMARHQEVPDDERALSSIVPLLPKRRIKFRGGNATGVVATNLGVINPAVSRVDGTEAEHFTAQMRYAGVTKAMLDQFGGLQIVGSGRLHGQVSVWALAYQPGRPNSNDCLLHDLSSVLNDFWLSGTHL